MITLFTGSPGAGKTASLVDFLSKLPGDRPIFSDGLNGLTLPHTVVDANDWSAQLPDGAILVIDEVQRVWRPRGPGSKVPDSVAQLETHRHRGIDVFLTTQAPRLLDSNVRGLVGRHVHIRDTGILGRYWYEWPECNDSMTWKTCINKKRISLPKKAFALYKSSSLHTVPVRGVPRALLVGVIALVLLAFLVYGVYRIVQKTQAPPLPVATASPVPAISNSSTSLVRTRSANEYVDYIPRISNRPESAPAYDHLRVVVVMPVITGAACINDQCKCFTAQGSSVAMTSSECLAWAKSPPFNPYLLEKKETESVHASPSLSATQLSSVVAAR